MPDSPLTLNFPASLDTVVSGGEVANRAFTTLSNTITDTALSIPLTDSAVFPATGVVTLTDSLTAPTKTEDVIYTANSANTLTVPTGGRGAFGSTAQNWSGTVYARMRMLAEHHEFNRDAVIALETKLGYTASTPTNGKFMAGSTTAGTSAWRVLTSGDIPDLSATYALSGHNHSGVYEPANANIQAHIASTSNPHSVTKSQVGLGSVENTALSTWAGSTNLTTLGTISAGTWNGAVIGASYGGAGSISGILKANGSGTVSAAVAGTDYLSATAPGSSGEVLYNNANAYAAASLVNYAASGSPALTVTGNASGAAFIREPTSSASPILVAASPALFTLQVADGSTFWQMAYTSDASPNSFANYLQDTGELTFKCYRSSDDAALGSSHILPFGGLAISNYLHSRTVNGLVYQSGDDIFALGRDGGFDLSETPASVDLTWGSRGITFRAPASAIADGSIAASHMHFYLDEAADALKVKWKESGGTVFSRTLANLDQAQTFTNKTLTASSNVLGGVTMTLGSDADGDIYYRSSNVLTRLPKGAANQQLRMNAGATAPEWFTASSGGLTVGTSAITSGTATRLLYETSGNVLGEISGATSDGINVTFGSGNLIATSAALTTPAITTSATVTRNSLGATTAVGLELKNTTAAAAGAQQVSPATVWTGEGWKTTATAATQTVNFQAYVLPVQGAANPTATWVLKSQINGGGYTDRLTVTSAGNLTAARLLSSGNGSESSPYVAGSAGRGLYEGVGGLVITDGTARMVITNAPGVLVDGNLAIGWNSGGSVQTTQSYSTSLKQSAAGVVDINNGTTIGTTAGNARDLRHRASYFIETSSDPSASDVTIAGSNTKDVFKLYMKNDKVVISYNNSGTVTYLTIPLDGSTTTWTHSTSAP